MLKDNILTVFNQATDQEKGNGCYWYRGALLDCQGMADEYELPLHIVVGVVAALSPTNKWERNLVDARNMIDSFVNGGYVEDCAPCTYKTMRDKAWSILTRMEDREVTALVLNGPKITDFYHCILGEGTCVIDGHAWCIANNDRRTMQEVPSIGKAKRIELQQAYLEAAQAHNLKAYEMQAITWLTWKRIHNV